MSASKQRRCRECGTGQIRKVARFGRRASYKNMPDLEIPAQVKIPTCNRCGAEWLDQATARAIDRALEHVYRDELRQRFRRSIDAIVKHVSQRKLETLLGLSQGYLSKLRAGDRDPSPELVSDLALIARDPANRVQELEQFWSTTAA
jgi:NMD protein affecting ribosome stability and mRNA decay